MTQPPWWRGHSDVNAVAQQLAGRVPSEIYSHPKDCCRAAIACFRSMALAYDAIVPGAPAWIRGRWAWGPLSWPIHWCEILAERTADCGALSCLARHALVSTGHQALPLQLLVQYDIAAVSAWQKTWSRNAPYQQWLFGTLAYHEAVVVIQGDRNASASDHHPKVRFWDSTEAAWVEGRAQAGYGAVVAYRICASDGRGEQVEENLLLRRLGIDVGVWQLAATNHQPR